MISLRVPRLILSFALVVAVAPALLAEESPTELGSAMEDLNAAFRRLSRQVKDPAKNPDSLERVAQLMAASEKALKLVPSLAAEVPPDKREKFISGYRAAMKELMEVARAIEAALKAGENAAAVKLVERLKEMRSEGHKRYKKPE